MLAQATKQLRKVLQSPRGGLWACHKKHRPSIIWHQGRPAHFNSIAKTRARSPASPKFSDRVVHGYVFLVLGMVPYLYPSLSSAWSLFPGHAAGPCSVPTPSFTENSGSPCLDRDTRHSHASRVEASDEKLHSTSSVVERLPSGPPLLSAASSAGGSNRESSSTWYAWVLRAIFEKTAKPRVR